MILSGWGEEGQKKIKNSTVFIAGAGGLGSPVALYLAAAGIGCIRICDSSEIKLSNLNRQILYIDSNIGKRKAKSASETLLKINPHIKIVSLTAEIERKNISRLVSDAQIIIDCLDNYNTRYVINEFAVKEKFPFIHAGIYGMSGQITFFHSPKTPCLMCIFPAASPPGIFPVIGATTGIIGSMQALEALKYITGIGTLLKNKLIIWEGEYFNFEEISLEKNPMCPVCGNKY